MSDSRQSWEQTVWYGTSPVRWVLMPLTGLFMLISGLRRRLYAANILKIRKIPAPVVVVGNVNVGGTGKTPFTIWLVNELRNAGFRPGIVTRGYRGNVGPRPVLVDSASRFETVGDEALLLFKRGACPVAVHPDRVAAAELLLENDVDIVVSDDGLQHYRLGRDYEIAVVDGVRGFGNGYLLPAGPLRERPLRLVCVDEVMQHGRGEPDYAIGTPAPRHFELLGSSIRRIDESEERPLDSLSGSTVHAVAGIGHPERFFSMLGAAGMSVIIHPMADHAIIAESDLHFGDELPVVMTEKDAVKCRSLHLGDAWYVPAQVVISEEDREEIIRSLKGSIGTRQSI